MVPNTGGTLVVALLPSNANCVVLGNAISVYGDSDVEHGTFAVDLDNQSRRTYEANAWTYRHDYMLVCPYLPRFYHCLMTTPSTTCPIFPMASTIWYLLTCNPTRSSISIVSL